MVGLRVDVIHWNKSGGGTPHVIVGTVCHTISQQCVVGDQYRDIG